MTNRAIDARRASMLALALAAGCGASAAVGTTPAALDAPRADARAIGTGGIEGAIARAQERVTSAGLRASLERIAGPREVRTSRAHHDEVALFIESELRDAGCTVSRQRVTLGDESADNVVGEREGSEPGRIVVLAAHYDSVPGTPGADDNASGVAAMLAVARALSGLPMRASVRFVAFAFEEDGLVGSEAYVAALGAEAARLELAIVLDMVGYRSSAPGSQAWPAGVELLAAGRAIPTVGDFIGAFWLTDLPAPVVARFESASRYASDLPVRTLAIPRFFIDAAPDVLRGDHAPFWRASLPAIMVGDTGPFRNPHYHAETDTLDTLDLDFLTRVTQWLAAAVLLVAG